MQCDSPLLVPVNEAWRCGPGIGACADEEQQDEEQGLEVEEGRLRGLDRTSISSELTVLLCMCSAHHCYLFSASRCVPPCSSLRGPARARSPPPEPALDISPRRPPTGGQLLPRCLRYASSLLCSNRSSQNDTALTSRQCRRPAPSPAASRVVSKLSCAPRQKGGPTL